MEELDFAKITECVDTSSMSSEDIADGEAMFQMMKDAEISVSVINRNISLTSETENTALVSVKCDINITSMDETQTESVDSNWDLVKVDGKWLLAEFPEELQE